MFDRYEPRSKIFRKKKKWITIEEVSDYFMQNFRKGFSVGNLKNSTIL